MATEKIDYSIAMEKKLFPLIPDGKAPAVKWQIEKNRLSDFTQAEHYDSVAYAPNPHEVIVDVDDAHHIELVDDFFRKLNIQPFWYWSTNNETKKSRHYVFKLPKGDFFTPLGNNIGGSIFMTFNDGKKQKSAIDIKGNRRGYVAIRKKHINRIKPDVLEEEFTKASLCPILLLLPVTLGISYMDYKNQGRDDTVFRWIPKLRAKGFTEDNFIQFCVELKFLNNDPESVEETIEWAKRKWQSSLDMGEVKDFIQETLDYAKIDNKTIIAPKSDEPLDLYDVRTKAFKKEGSVDKETKETTWILSGIKDYKKLADYIIQETKLSISREDEQIWGIDDNGKFVSVKKLELFIKRFLIRRFENIKPPVINDIKNYIEGLIPIKNFEKNDFLIAFENCIYDAKEGKTITLKENAMLQNVIPHNLVPKEQWTPKHFEMAKKLETLLNEWTLNDKLFIKQILERIGIAMTRYMGLEKAFFIVGNSSNGKTIFLNMLVNLLGTENCSHEDLKELAEDKFASSNLYGKISNINFDISSAIMDDTSLFKRYISGDRVSASYKNQDKFRFSPYAKFFLGSNNIPYTRELGESDAVTRRLEIWPFDNKFVKNVSKDIEIKEIINQPEFYEVFILLALEHVKKALDANKFTLCARSRRALDEYNRETNPLFNFIEEEGIKHDEAATDIYRRYKIWCEKYGFTFFGYVQFIKKLQMTARLKGNRIAIATSDTIKGSKRHRVVEVERFEGQGEE